MSDKHTFYPLSLREHFEPVFSRSDALYRKTEVLCHLLLRVSIFVRLTDAPCRVGTLLLRSGVKSDPRPEMEVMQRSILVNRLSLSVQEALRKLHLFDKCINSNIFNEQSLQRCCAAVEVRP